MSEQKTSLFEESLKSMENARAIDTGWLEFMGGAEIG